MVTPVLRKSRNVPQPAPCVRHCVLSIAGVAPSGLPGSQGHSCHAWDLVGSSRARRAAGLWGEQRDLAGLLPEEGRQGAMLAPWAGTQTHKLARGSLARGGRGEAAEWARASDGGHCACKVWDRDDQWKHNDGSRVARGTVSRGLGGWDVGPHWLALPQRLLGHRKSSVCSTATLQHVFKSTENICYCKTSAALRGWSLLGTTSGRCWGVPWPLDSCPASVFCSGHSRREAGLRCPATRLGACAHRRPRICAATRLTPAP